jgi:phage terminase large subunit
MAEQIDVFKVIGKGYLNFWWDRHTYRVVKGGRSSKKSTTMAIWLIYNMMQYPLANALVVRQTGNTHATSTFAELQKATERLHVSSKWKFTVGPCEATYKPTGQKIYFRGFDDELKLTSITTPKGVLCWVWVEEAYEIEDEKAFDTLCEGIRGKDIEDSGLWKQITLTYNPWVNSHWTKKRYWDNEDPDAFRLTTTHKCNEFLSQKDHDDIEKLRSTDPERYQVVGLGEYGIPGGAFFEEFRKSIHVIKPFPIPDDWKKFLTIDYGMDMLAAYWIALDWHNRAYVYREVYKSGLFVSDAADVIKRVNGGDKIYQYFAPPDLDNRNNQTGKSTLDLFLEYGIPFMKVSNNREQGWLNVHEWLKPFKDEQGVETASLVFFDTCPNVIRCLSQIAKDEKNPNDCATEPHELTHGPDAIRYWTSGRAIPPKKKDESKYPVNSLEYRVEKNLEKLLKKRRTAW